MRDPIILLVHLMPPSGVGAQPFGFDEAAVGSLAALTAAGARSRHEIEGPSEVQDEVSRWELVSVRAGFGSARGASSTDGVRSWAAHVGHRIQYVARE